MACRKRATRNGWIIRAASWPRLRRSLCSGCWARRIWAAPTIITPRRCRAVNVGLLDGQLAWRQHDGGHTDGPNWKYFIPWADKFLRTHACRYKNSVRFSTLLFAAVSVASAQARAGRSARRAHGSKFADRAPAVARQGQAGRHRYLLRRRFHHAALGRDRLSGSCWPTGTQNFFGWNAADFGWGADTVQNILWRLDNGELDGVNPKVDRAAGRDE